MWHVRWLQVLRLEIEASSKFTGGIVVNPGKGDLMCWTLWLLDLAGAHCGGFGVVLLWVIPRISAIIHVVVCKIFRKHRGFFDLQDGHYECLYYCDAWGVAFTAEKNKSQKSKFTFAKPGKKYVGN